MISVLRFPCHYYLFSTCAYSDLWIYRCGLYKQTIFVAKSEINPLDVFTEASGKPFVLRMDCVALTQLKHCIYSLG